MNAFWLEDLMWLKSENAHSKRTYCIYEGCVVGCFWVEWDSWQHWESESDFFVQKFLAVNHDFHCFQQPNFISFMRRTFWKGVVGFWSRKFQKGRIFYLRHRNPDIYMYQLILLLLHVEPQARAKHDFDLQLTANISLFFLPFWGFYCDYFTFF